MASTFPQSVWRIFLALFGGSADLRAVKIISLMTYKIGPAKQTPTPVCLQVPCLEPRHPLHPTVSLANIRVQDHFLFWEILPLAEG